MFASVTTVTKVTPEYAVSPSTHVLVIMEAVISGRHVNIQDPINGSVNALKDMLAMGLHAREISMR